MLNRMFETSFRSISFDSDEFQTWRISFVNHQCIYSPE